MAGPPLQVLPRFISSNTFRQLKFIVPGIVTILIGIAFAISVVHEDRKGSRQAAAQARVAKQDMWRVILSLLIVVIAISTTFNAVTVALPKLFAERLADLVQRIMRT